MPDSVLHDEALNQALSVLPANYNFEVNCSMSKCSGEHTLKGLLMCMLAVWICFLWLVFMRVAAA